MVYFEVTYKNDFRKLATTANTNMLEVVRRHHLELTDRLAAERGNVVGSITLCTLGTGMELRFGKVMTCPEDGAPVITTGAILTWPGYFNIFISDHSTEELYLMCLGHWIYCELDQLSNEAWLEEVVTDLLLKPLPEGLADRGLSRCWQSDEVNQRSISLEQQTFKVG